VHPLHLSLALPPRARAEVSATGKLMTGRRGRMRSANQVAAGSPPLRFRLIPAATTVRSHSPEVRADLHDHAQPFGFLSCDWGNLAS
jgi:hypothetical protein